MFRIRDWLRGLGLELEVGMRFGPVLVLGLGYGYCQEICYG